MRYFILVRNRRNKVGRPSRNPYQVARTQRAAAYIDYFIQRCKTDRSTVIDLLRAYEYDHYADAKLKDKQNLRVWFNDTREGKIAKPNKRTIFDLCKVLGKLEDPICGEADPFLIYVPLSCRLHFTPFELSNYEDIEFRGTDWYQAIKIDPAFPDSIDLIYDRIESEDIAIDVAELMEEPIGKWIEVIHSLNYDPWEFIWKKGGQYFKNKRISRAGNKAYFILSDWLIYKNFSLKKWRIQPSNL